MNSLVALSLFITQPCVESPFISLIKLSASTEDPNNEFVTDKILQEIISSAKMNSNEEVALNSKFIQLRSELPQKELSQKNILSLTAVIKKSSPINYYNCKLQIQKLYTCLRNEDKSLESLVIQQCFTNDLPEILKSKNALSRNLETLCDRCKDLKLPYQSLKIILDEINSSKQVAGMELVYNTANDDSQIEEESLVYYAKYTILKIFKPRSDEIKNKIKNHHVMLKVLEVEINEKDRFSKLEKLLNDPATSLDDRMLVRMLLWDIKPYEIDIYKRMFELEKGFSEKIILILVDHLKSLPDCEDLVTLQVDLLGQKFGSSIKNQLSIMLMCSNHVSPANFKKLYALLRTDKNITILPIIAFYNMSIITNAECSDILSQLLDYKKIPDDSKFKIRPYLYASLSKVQGWTGNEKILIDEFYNAGGATAIPALLKSSNMDEDLIKCLSDALTAEKYYHYAFGWSIRDVTERNWSTHIYATEYPLPILILEAAQSNQKIKLSKKTLVQASALLKNELATIATQKERMNQVKHFERALKIVDALLLEVKP